MLNAVSLPASAIIDAEYILGATLPISKVVTLAEPPAKIRTLVAKLEEHKRFRADQSVLLYKLSDVFVTGEGVVFDRNLNVFRETITQTSNEDIVAQHHQLMQSIGLGCFTSHHGKMLLCGKAGLSNYGHWMLEMLPIAYRMKAEIIKENIKVLVPKVYPSMKDVIQDSLQLLGIAPPLWVFGGEHPAWIETLYLVKGLSEHGVFFLPQTAECLSEVSKDIPADACEKLWISRIGLRRTLQNEASICNVLRDGGWRIIDPSRMRLSDQIAAAKGARFMAGVNGAGLTNLGFMQIGSVVSFMPTTMPDNFFALLAANRNIDFTEVRCQVDPSPDWAFDWNGPVLIEPHEVFRQIRHADLPLQDGMDQMPISRADVAQKVLDLFEAPRYLEIGVSQGITFKAISASRKVAVDPVFGFACPESNDQQQYHQVTSDRYFGSIVQPRERFDVIFIDGLHTAEQSLRDLINALRYISDDGVIIIDDTIPNSYDASLANLSQVLQLRSTAKTIGAGWTSDDSWMGDVFKNVFFVATFLQQWSYATVKENHGQTILWQSRRGEEELGKRSLKEISELDYRCTVLERSAFNIMALDEILSAIGPRKGSK